jgi:hypothetical protein
LRKRKGLFQHRRTLYIESINDSLITTQSINQSTKLTLIPLT